MRVRMEIVTLTLLAPSSSQWTAHWPCHCHLYPRLGELTFYNRLRPTDREEGAVSKLRAVLWSNSCAGSIDYQPLWMGLNNFLWSEEFWVCIAGAKWEWPRDGLYGSLAVGEILMCPVHIHVPTDAIIWYALSNKTAHPDCNQIYC